MNNDTKNFNSPTTPGLKIDFKNYLVELVCINQNPKLGPKFWKDQKYWSKKYIREIKGVSNLSKLLDNFNDPLVCRATVYAIKNLRIQCLLAKKTIDKLSAYIKKIAIAMKNKFEIISMDQELRSIVTDNYDFRSQAQNDILNKIRKVESNGQEKSN